MALSNSKQSELKYHLNAEEFVPYAAHFDEETVITKNGELMQVIKVTGFAYETIREGKEGFSPLRQLIREAIKKYIDTDDYAIWIHTMRRSRDISTEGAYDQGFSNELNEKWIERNSWRSQFVNELYVSIMIEGEALSIKNPKLFLESLFVESEFRSRKEALEKAAKKLAKVTDNILGHIQEYGARKLGLFKRDGMYYSEMMSFASKIMNLKQEDVPLLPADLSKVLPTHKVSFQYNTIQVEGDTGRHFGAVFSIKEYHEVSMAEIDKFLQLPIHFIVSECFDFINRNQALDAFKEQNKIYDLSGRKYMKDVSGITEILENDTGKSTDFGEHQIVITILEDTVKAMQKAVSDVVDTLRDMGVVFVREDLFMEDCYWSMLPGNFDFIRRVNFIPTLRVGGYASLYNFPAGKLVDNHWGSAVTVFHTAKNTPYFFNFHFDKNGHTTLIGPYGTGKTVLMNFLVSEAQKFRGKTFYFEKGRGSEIFVRAIDGKYHQITKEVDNGKLHFNPLLLEDNKDNREFLEHWLEYLIEFVDETGEDAQEFKLISEEDAARIKEALKLNYSLPIEKRRLSNIIPQIWQPGTSTYNKLSYWFGEGKFAKYFDSGIDDSGLLHEKIIGFDMSQIVEKKSVTIPMISYLLHMAECALDGETPTIIVLDEAWSLIDNPAFVSRLDDWLSRIIYKNGIVIFATESVEEAERSSITRELTNLIKTKIFLPNPDADDDYKSVFDITEKELKAIRGLDKKSRQFLLKHNTDSVLAKLDLGGLKREIAVLSANDEKLAAMEKAIEAVGSDDPEQWPPVYYSNMNL